MSRKHHVFLAIAACCAALAGLPRATAAPVTWDIDPTLSSISLSVQDTVLDINGLTTTIRIRNQSTSSGGNLAWNVGNKAFLDGQLNTNYTPGGNIQFLTNPVGQVIGLNSGSYRPNPAAFNSANTNSDSPDGQFSNATTSAAAFGGRLRGVFAIGTFDPGYLSIKDVSLDTTSGALPLTGIPSITQTFASSGLDIDLLSALLNLDAVALPLGAGQVIPDMLNEPISMTGSNLAGNATIVPYGVGAYKLTIPIVVTWAFDLGGNILPLTVTGTIVAYSTPEPSTLLLGTIGMVGLAVTIRKRRRRSGHKFPRN